MSKPGKLDLQDKKSAWAASFNAAAAIVAASTSKGGVDISGIADLIVELQVALYTARIAATKELKLGGVEGKSTAGSGGKSERSDGSRRSSAQPGSPGSPTEGQISYYEDIAGRVAANGGKLKPGVNKFKAMSYHAAKAALEEAIRSDPGK